MAVCLVNGAGYEIDVLGILGRLQSRKAQAMHDAAVEDPSHAHLETTIALGRDPDCDVCISNSGSSSKLYRLISRKHCRLALRDGALFVLDGAHWPNKRRGSLNGTYVGQRRVEYADDSSGIMLKDGDVIGLGAPIAMWGKRNPYNLLVRTAGTPTKGTWAPQDHSPGHMMSATREHTIDDKKETMKKLDLSLDDAVKRSVQQLRGRFKSTTYRVAGVTFENRQQVLIDLLDSFGGCPSTPIMFEREPDNVFDPKAVSVKLLDGTRLGFIPRFQTDDFVHDLCFGTIKSIGRVQSPTGVHSAYGCVVQTKPQIPALCNLGIPSDLLPNCSRVVEYLEGPTWDAYKINLCRKTNYRCCLTNAETCHVEAKWSIEASSKVVRLVGFRVQHECLRYIQFFEDVTVPAVQKSIASLNGLELKDAASIFNYYRNLSDTRAGKGWTVDVALLEKEHLIGN